MNRQTIATMGAALALTLAYDSTGRAQEAVAPTNPRDAASQPMVLESMMEQRWAALGEDRSAEEAEAFAYREAERMALHRAGYRIFVWGDASQCDAEGVCVSERPVIKCRSMRICDIELQLGEQLRDFVISDAANWAVGVRATGAGRASTQHFYMRPSGAGMEVVSLILYTNRRIYHLELQRTQSSSAEQHMPLVAFHYPEEFRARWLLEHGGASGATGGAGIPAGVFQATGADAAREALAEVDPRNLDFRYEIDVEGRRRVRRAINWEPLRVFDDGIRTIVEMPLTMLRREAPVLLVREAGQDVIVNYRIVGNLFVVDRLFDEAILIKGVGRGQERVAIRRVSE